MPLSHWLAPTLALLATLATTSFAQAQEADYPTIGSITRLDPRLDQLIAPDAKIEKVAEGFDWAEGPLWIKDGGYLLFSDVPQNVVFRWDEKNGAREAIRPSGYTGDVPRGGEPGSNGLTLDPQGRLVLMQHGDRRVSRREGEKFIPLVTVYEGKRFNSPNDGTFDSKGNLYFTDPPYGLVGGVDDPKKEIPFQGVFRLSSEGKLTLLTDKLSRPNGIAFSPDEKTLYIANSDPERAVWMAYPVKDDGSLGAGRVFFDATNLVGPERPGLPDGLKVDTKGNLFAAGPGGVLVFDPDGTHLGTIVTGQANGNVAFGGADGSVLYIAADMELARVPTRTQGR